MAEDFSLIEKMRYPVSFPDKDINYYLKMLKGEIEEKHKLKPVLKSFPERGTVILLTSRDLGGGEPSYSKKLMERFIFAISRASVKPRMIISLNEAVFFMAEDSPILDSLRILAFADKQVPQDLKTPVFHQVFLDNIKRWGRQYELGLLLTFKARVKDPFSDLITGIKMIFKRKLSLLPEQNPGKQAIKDICRRTGWSS